MTSTFAKRWATLGILAVVLFAAPAFADEFRLNLLAKFLTFAIVALGVDLVWGYTGMLSLGHGVFFGIGAYAAGMYLKLESTNGGMADFMGWSGLKELPAVWFPFANPIFAFSMAIILPTLLAALVAYLVGSSRITGVYFSLLTQALALILSIALIGQQAFTGGTNGITNFSTVLGFSLRDQSTQQFLYFLTVVTLLASYVLCKWVVNSRFGGLLVAIRDDEQRVRFCGYDPRAAKVLVMALSGGLAGLAGALFVMQVGIISPAMLGIVPSVEMVIWVAMGGRGTLIGAVLGAILVNSAKSGLSESFPDLWQMAFGALLVGVVLLFPDGLVGAVKRAYAQLSARTRTAPAVVPPLAAADGGRA
jgi:urea transport system permease protein